MEGCLVDANQVVGTSEEYLWALRYSDKKAMEATKDEWRLEKFSDTPSPEPFEEHCLFHKGPNRVYFINNFKVQSVYRAVCTEKWNYYEAQDPMEHCAVIMMSAGKFAAGIFKNYKLYSEVELRSRTDPLPRTDKKFRKDVERLLHDMRSDLSKASLVFVRCREEDKIMITGGDCGKEESKFRHIPFVTGTPSGDNLLWCFNKLRSVCSHGSLGEFLENKRNTSISDSSKENNAKLIFKSKEQRNLEKEKWSWVEPRFTERICRLICKDDVDSLVDLINLRRFNEEFIDYLNNCHPVLENSTFLHLAVRNNSCKVTQILLEYGSNPSISNENGKVPFELCGSDEMRSIFVDFREENEENVNWNKSKIPERKEEFCQKLPRDDEIFENAKRAMRDEKRTRRRQKLNKRRVFAEEY